MSRYDDLEIATLVDRIDDAELKGWVEASVDDVIRELGHVLLVLGEPNSSMLCLRAAGSIEVSLGASEKLEDLEGVISSVFEDLEDPEDLEKLQAKLEQMVEVPEELDLEKVEEILEKLPGLDLDKVIKKLDIKALQASK